MKKILKIDEAIKIAKELREKNKTIVLAGGCFDILHIGHVKFLQSAKQEGGMLLILLESDKSIRKSKGKNRPINSQKDRAMLLSEISSVDYIVILKRPMTNQEYDQLVIALKPDIIAFTKGDRDLVHKQRQANLIGARLSETTVKITDKSTTRLVKLLSKDISL